MKNSFKRLHRFFAKGFLPLAAICLMTSSAANAGIILVGTVVESQNESISKINNLINTYNTDFTASLPTVQSFIDKLQDNPNGDLVWENNVFSNTDFKFFEQDGAAPSDRTVSIFNNASVTFDDSTLTSSNFANVDNPVLGFERQNQSAPSFNYYVSKDGNLGWSLWYTDMLGTNDFNPFYTDSATGGFTRGAITDNSLAYDPITSGVSHISFYSSSTFDPDEIVPEPASLALLGLGGLLAGAGVARRRKQTAEIE